MTTIAVSRCAQCNAVINIHWTACLVCRAIISSTPEAAAPSQHTPDHHGGTGKPIALSKSGSATGVVAQDHPMLELSDGEAVRLLTKGPDNVWLIPGPGDVVEWLSPALPKQQGRVLGVYQDDSFEVFHPLSEALCRLPMAWITRVVNRSIHQTGGSTVAVMGF